MPPSYPFMFHFQFLPSSLSLPSLSLPPLSSRVSLTSVFSHLNPPHIWLDKFFYNKNLIRFFSAINIVFLFPMNKVQTSFQSLVVCFWLIFKFSFWPVPKPSSLCPDNSLAIVLMAVIDYLKITCSFTPLALHIIIPPGVHFCHIVFLDTF